MILGAGRLQVRLETLPGERVLWEGAPPRGAMLIRMTRALLPWAVLLAVAAFLVSLIALIGSLESSSPRANDVSRPASHVKLKPLAVAVIALWAGTVAAAPLLALRRARREFRNAYNVVTNERICIQSGSLTCGVAIIDLDKVLSIEVSASVLERRFGLQTIRFTHAGTPSAPTPFLLTTPNVMAFVPADSELLSNIVNAWLPRDNALDRPPSGLG